MGLDLESAPVDATFPPTWRLVSKHERRKVKYLLNAFGLDDRAVRKQEMEFTGKWDLSFRAFRRAYPDCPMRLTFEHPAGIEYLREQPFREVLIDFRKRFYLSIYEEVKRRIRPNLPECVEPIGIVLPGQSGHGYILHEDERFCEGPAIRWPRNPGQPGPYPFLWLQTYSSFIKTLKKQWHPLRSSGVVSADQPGDDQPTVTNADIQSLLGNTQTSRRELAKAIEVSEGFMSQLLSSKKRWPKDKIAKAHEFLQTKVQKLTALIA